ncbi:MAG: hypothetical protein MUE30_13535 [Spirosomaceae bacterium]|nr:hypothetical protein [Spirosomataceae bacterium]
MAKMTLGPATEARKQKQTCALKTSSFAKKRFNCIVFSNQNPKRKCTYKKNTIKVSHYQSFFNCISIGNDPTFEGAVACSAHELPVLVEHFATKYHGFMADDGMDARFFLIG